MKIINIHKNITQQALFDLVKEKLNPLFYQQKQSEINFQVNERAGSIEISQPDLYEGVLFSIVIKGKELQITRSEHYVDDVNSLTVESILNTIFEELSGDEGVSLTIEG